MIIGRLETACVHNSKMTVTPASSSRRHSLGFSMRAIDDAGIVHAVGSLAATSFGVGLDTIVDDEATRAVIELYGDRSCPPAPPIFVISQVEIQEAYRGLGLGKAIMLLFMKQYPGTHLLLAETSDKPWLQAFYTSLGFMIFGLHYDDTAMIRRRSYVPDITIEDGQIVII